MIQCFLKTGKQAYRVAILLSGSGSNAERLLESVRGGAEAAWEAVVLVTDRPESSRARELAQKFGLALIEHDIKSFYVERGASSISLFSERGRELRQEWTDELRRRLADFAPDFGILAGFIPLTNLTADFPCLNVHPGDLTVTENGRRLLVGLHTIPIETAILRGFCELRSSVIIAQPYTGSGGEMDSGPVLGISGPVGIELGGLSVNELREIAARRPDKKPRGGWGDVLEDLARKNQERLKEDGDWKLFPPLVADFAAGKFGIDENGRLHFLENGTWIPVQTVEYREESRIPVNLKSQP